MTAEPSPVPETNKHDRVNSAVPADSHVRIYIKFQFDQMYTVVDLYTNPGRFWGFEFVTCPFGRGPVGLWLEVAGGISGHRFWVVRHRTTSGDEFICSNIVGSAVYTMKVMKVYRVVYFVQISGFKRPKFASNIIVDWLILRSSQKT